jgi:flagellar P-ring protein precursor FlgI
VPAGALVEREIPTTFAKNDTVTLALRDADFRTAARIVAAVDRDLGPGSATPVDAGSITVRAPAALRGRPVELVARLSDLEVSPASVARVVINERTGTIVAGGDVRLAPVAIAHGGITIVIKETPQPSQPVAPFGKGSTVVVPRTDINATEQAPPMTFIQGATTLSEVAGALATLGVGPRDLAGIFQALRTAGALRAEIVIQ